ncbi:gfo/Idh/MocA family oxidoreductase, partial [Streptomyces sp. SID10244]|nr:gfo/Idh/MocA family oxidoreductase [Streptomyces sp. SID10244]
IRQMVIGGTKRTLVWDDLNPQQRVSVYDRGVDLALQSKETADARAANVSYRLGDTWAPALPEHEALTGVVSEFATAIRTEREARTNGEAGLHVLSILDAAAGSLRAAGAPCPVTTDNLTRAV